MINLLKNNPAESDVAALLQKERPFFLAASAPKWRDIGANPSVARWVEAIREVAENEIDQPLPELSDALYREFYETGGRASFEKACHERRLRLSRAVVCSVFIGEGRWLQSALEKLEKICGEYSWATPANVNAPSGKDPKLLDSSTAETAAVVAVACSILDDQIPRELRERIEHRLRDQVFENYIHRHEDLWWTKSATEANPACHCGILTAALALNSQLLPRLLLTARKYLPIYLAGFGRDGACANGPGYWQHGFGAFCLLNEQIEHRTGGELSLIHGDSHVTEIAKYGPRVTLADFHLVNFSDTPSTGTIKPFLLSYLGRRLNSKILRTHGYRSYQRLEQNGLNLRGPQSELLYLLQLFRHCPSDHSEEGSLESEDVFFRDSGIIVSRGRDLRGNLWEFSAKAGHNAESHNHNDCGSFIVNINGEPVIVEIGSPEFSKDYFGEARYDFLAARTLGHSLPIINGYEQVAGPHAAAKILSADLTDEYAEFTVELTACYPSNAQCAELVRSLYFNKRIGRLSVKDYFELWNRESLETAVITGHDVKLDGRAAVIRCKTGAIVIKPTEDTFLLSVESHEYRDHAGNPRQVKRVVLGPRHLGEQRSIGYDVEFID